MPGVFWGRSLYFHGVAFVTFVIALSGMAATLFSFVDAVVAPRCPTGFISIDCTDTGAAVRAATNGIIVVLVAGVIWWWHLREGRRAVTPDPDASVPMMGVS